VAVVSPWGRAGLAEVLGRTASQMNEYNVSNTLDALGVIPEAAAELSPSARKGSISKPPQRGGLPP